MTFISVVDPTVFRFLRATDVYIWLTDVDQDKLCLFLMMVGWKLFYNSNSIITLYGYSMWTFLILIVTFWISLLTRVWHCDN